MNDSKRAAIKRSVKMMREASATIESALLDERDDDARSHLEQAESSIDEAIAQAEIAIAKKGTAA